MSFIYTRVNVYVVPVATFGIVFRTTIKLNIRPTYIYTLPTFVGRHYCKRFICVHQ